MHGTLVIGPYTSGAEHNKQIVYTTHNNKEFKYTHRHMGSQCGIAILHGCYPADNACTKTISKHFVQDLRDYYCHGGGNGLGKVIMSAVVGSNLHKLLKQSDQWQFGTAVRNPNSSSYIQTFELDISVGKRKPS